MEVVYCRDDDVCFYTDVAFKINCERPFRYYVYKNLFLFFLYVNIRFFSDENTHRSRSLILFGFPKFPWTIYDIRQL